jgi:Na+/H+-dicarboxylate symporter/ABC-type amino acid transport substrate-binding protein
MRLFKVSLTLQMAIATVLGIFCGLFFGDLCDLFSPYANAYIMLLKVTAVPYLIGAIIHGVGQLSLFQAKQIVKKGIVFISLAWFINILIVYAINDLFPHPSSTQLGGYISGDIPPLDFAQLLIPDNIFFDLANNVVPAIVIFSLLIGIALMYIKEKEVMMRGLENLVQALTYITSWIARITPIGTFLIIANQVGTIQLSTVKQVSTYVILYILGVSLVIFWIFPRLTNMLTSIPSYKWLQQLLPILVLAYTTNVVIVCLPYIIELLKKETQLLDPQDNKAQNQIQGTVSVVFNLPLGSIFIAVFVFFVSIFYNVSLTIPSQFELFVTTFLTSLGAVGLGSWINSLTFILDSLGLPIDSVNLYLTTLPFTAGFQSMVSVVEIASLSLFITLACRNMIIWRWSRILKKSVFTLIPIFLLIWGIKTFNPLPEIKNETKSIYELNISSSIPIKIYKTAPPVSPFQGDTFDRIMTTKTLRVGYNPSCAPFCFYNVDGTVVGYDIAFAYELAYDLGCQLEMIPLNYEKLINELNQSSYDIAMSAVTVNENRLKALTFTTPYMMPRLCLVVPKKLRKKLSTLQSINENNHVQIAVLKGSSFEAKAKELFPHKTLTFLQDYEEFSTKQEDLVLVWEEQEAIAWSLCHRNFRIVFLQPPIGFDTLSYAIRNDSPRFIHYLDQWLALKTSEGFTDKQYELWIKGKTEIATLEEPRWSIIRNVLHWVD